MAKVKVQKHPDTIKKGTKVRIEFDASVLNPVKNPDGTITGYRVTDKKRRSFWAVVPLHAIHVVEAEKELEVAVGEEE